MEESPIDRVARRGAVWKLAFAVAYAALVVYLLVNPNTRIVGVFNVVALAFIISWYVLKVGFDDAPHWVRGLIYRGWHGKYRAFEDRRVRVIDGERHTPSRVFAADIFDILGQSPSAAELMKLAARYGTSFEKGIEGLAEGEWLFADEACMAYVRGQMDEQRTQRGRDAMKLAIWLERDVFMPIDNRRTAETGRNYAFTKQTTRR